MTDKNNLCHHTTTQTENVVSQLKQMGEKMETQLKELKTGQETQYKEVKAQYEEVRTSQEKLAASILNMYFLLAIILISIEKDFVKAILATIFKRFVSK